MNNKFWRDVFDQISSLILIFRKESSDHELMFVNRAVQSYLGYKPESYVLESEQKGSLRDELETICRLALNGETRIQLTTLSGKKNMYSVEVSDFYSESIKEQILIMTVHGVSDAEMPTDSSSNARFESQLMSTVRNRISQGLEQGANLAFVGAQGTGKRFFSDEVLARLIQSDYQIVKMDYSAGHVEIFCDGVHSDFDHLQSLRKSKPIALFIYELQEMGEKDQKLIMEWAKQPDRNVRFIVGSRVSLDQMVSEGRLHPELYYLMNLTSVVLPGLHHRRSEIQPYAEHLIRKICDASGVAYPKISEKEWTRLFNYDFKIHFDDLNTIILRSVIRAEEGAFEFNVGNASSSTNQKRKGHPKNDESSVVIDLDVSGGYDEHMRIYLSQVLERTNGKIYGKDGAAAVLGMKPTTLQSKLDKYRVRV
jgi:transcriptional regulator with PAS, ATPase and Fis domain